MRVVAFGRQGHRGPQWCVRGPGDQERTAQDTVGRDGVCGGPSVQGSGPMRGVEP